MRTRRLLRLVVSAVAVLAAAGGWLWKTNHTRAIALEAIPVRPDLATWPVDFAAALDNAEAAVRAHPGPGPGLVRLGELYDTNGFAAEAAGCYRALAELQPGEAKWPYLRANFLARSGRLEEALPLQRQAAGLAPGNFNCRLRLGDMELKNNQPTAAARSYTAALELAPSNPYPLVGLARCALASGNWPEARTRLLRAVQYPPGYSGAWGLLATVQDHLGDVAGAKEARRAASGAGRFREAPDPWLDPGIDTCFDAYQLSVAADLSLDAAEARRRLERAIRLAPASSTYHRLLARLLITTHETALARQHLETAVTLAPSDNDSWIALVDLLVAAGDMGAAGHALASGLAHCPDSGYLHFLNGKRLRSLQRDDEAEAEFKTSKVLQPGRAQAYMQLAAMYFLKSRFSDAIGEARSALAAEPGKPDIMVAMIELCIIGNDEAEARQWLAALHQSPYAIAEEVAAVEKNYREKFGHAPP